jgi:LmbE family N-acetylglucosaminyl deacetylase
MISRPAELMDRLAAVLPERRVNSRRRVLVIAAHPDDELLGCGGTVALHTRAGDEVTSVIVCEGESLRYGPGGVGQRSHIHRAADTLGVRTVHTLNFPDQRLDTKTLTDIITPLEQIVREVRPQLVYVQHGGDINRDHQILFQATLVATRPTEPSIQAVYAFDTACSTEWAYPRTFSADTWVDISSTLDLKLQAMACYESEVREYPHPRSLEALQYRARAWGNQHCLDAAEAFQTIRRTLRHGQTPV